MLDFGFCGADGGCGGARPRGGKSAGEFSRGAGGILCEDARLIGLHGRVGAPKNGPLIEHFDSR